MIANNFLGNSDTIKGNVNSSKQISDTEINMSLPIDQYVTGILHICPDMFIEITPYYIPTMYTAYTLYTMHLLHTIQYVLFLIQHTLHVQHLINT